MDPSAEKLRLYKCSFAVQPTPQHPIFYELGYTFLNLWLFAADPNDASERAGNILAELPYELLYEKCRVAEIVKPTIRPEDRESEARARQIGFAIHADALALGTNEEEFKQVLNDFMPSDPE